MPSQTVVYVYPDVVFAISSIMNLAILWGTKRLSRLNPRGPRLATGALFGGLYSAAAAYPHLEWLHTFEIKMFFGILMFAITFAPASPKRLLKGFLYFMLVSFSIGGIFFGVIFLVNSSGINTRWFNGLQQIINENFMLGLSITLFVVALLIKVGIPLYKKGGLYGVQRIPLKVTFNNQQVEIEALVDTGNQLQDPLSMAPVIIVELRVLEEHLPAELVEFFKKDGTDYSALVRVLTDEFWSTRFRIIPFASLGKSNGMLVGFRPDLIEMRKEGKALTNRDVIVGISKKKLSPEGNYNALLHPDLLQEISA